MTKDQERHLARIKKGFLRRVDPKYRKGQAEHGGNLFDVDPEKLLDYAIDEAIDQVVYLLTTKERLYGRRSIR